MKKSIYQFNFIKYLFRKLEKNYVIYNYVYLEYEDGNNMSFQIPVGGNMN